jgi:hypothetical protein
MPAGGRPSQPGGAAQAPKSDPALRAACAQAILGALWTAGATRGLPGGGGRGIGDRGDWVDGIAKRYPNSNSDLGAAVHRRLGRVAVFEGLRSLPNTYGFARGMQPKE